MDNSAGTANSTTPRARQPSISLNKHSDEKHDYFSARSLELCGGHTPAVAHHKKLNVWRLAGIAFVFTCSGPFGVEAALRAGGPGLGMLGICLTPLVFVLPQIAMVAELATMIPSNHGYVAWVSRAFGSFLGFQNAFCSMLANFVDMAVYTALFSAYLFVRFAPDAPFFAQYLVRLVCVIVATLFALLESKHVAEISAAIGSLVMLPFVVGFCLAAKSIRPSQWVELWPDKDWALWGSSLCWLFTGWNSLGNLAAEVKFPHVYSRGMGIAIVLDVLAYLVTVAAALTVPPSKVVGEKIWGDGYLVVAMEVILPGLGTTIAVAAALSIFGMLVNCMTCYARAVAGMAELGWLPSLLAKTRPGTLVPHNSVFAFTVIVSILSLFDFDLLIKVDLILAAESYILTFLAFLRLRYTEADTPRPYKVPLGMFGAWSTTLMKIAVMLFSMLAVFLDQPHITVPLTVAINLLIIGLYITMTHPRFEKLRVLLRLTPIKVEMYPRMKRRHSAPALLFFEKSPQQLPVINETEIHAEHFSISHLSEKGVNAITKSESAGGAPKDSPPPRDPQLNLSIEPTDSAILASHKGSRNSLVDKKSMLTENILHEPSLTPTVSSFSEPSLSSSMHALRGSALSSGTENLEHEDEFESSGPHPTLPFYSERKGPDQTRFSHSMSKKPP